VHAGSPSGLAEEPERAVDDDAELAPVDREDDDSRGEPALHPDTVTITRTAALPPSPRDPDTS